MRFSSYICLLALSAIFFTVNSSTAAVDFAKEVAPILQKHCIRCHHENNKKGDISLSTKKDLQEGQYFNFETPANSPLLKLLVPAKEGKKPRMPKEGAILNDLELKTLTQWVKEGAIWPETVVILPKQRADANWWSFQPLKQHDQPAIPDAPKEWQQNPIDHFIWAKLAENQLKSNPMADDLTLLRRTTYDLIGLPPTPEEIRTYLADKRQNKFELLVDRLLASPRYGEHWGRHWLDVVRFGESNGFERNILIQTLWPFRDYVIDAMNSDKPFHHLIQEHIAGDQFASERPEARHGTTFLVCGPYDNVGNSDAYQAAIIRANTIDEMIRATTETFLGITVGCARCHDHKFDPISQQDYHAFNAIFAGVKHGDQQVKHARTARQQDLLEKELKQYQSELEAATKAKKTEDIDRISLAIKNLEKKISLEAPPKPTWVGTFQNQKGPFHIFQGGDPAKKGSVVAIQGMEAFRTRAFHFQLPNDATDSAKRRALADWLISPENPLTARVIVNRLWHYHFGTGIVATPSDFGLMGSPPSHPELLDFLAKTLQKGEWKLKSMHRMIVTSQTYQQSSAFRPEAAEKDGDSRLLWRFPPRRLTGEEIRDGVLQMANLLRHEGGDQVFNCTVTSRTTLPPITLWTNTM
ncbi:MAG: DUF1549 and DUF1553 domain-containing protein [Zavarzinella sp.]